MLETLGESATPEAIQAKVKEVERLVSTASGFDSKRGDQISVEAVEFVQGQGMAEGYETASLMGPLIGLATGLIKAITVLGLVFIVVTFGLRPVTRLLLDEKETQVAGGALASGAAGADDGSLLASEDSETALQIDSAAAAELLGILGGERAVAALHAAHERESSPKVRGVLAAALASCQAAPPGAQSAAEARELPRTVHPPHDPTPTRALSEDARALLEAAFDDCYARARARVAPAGWQDVAEVRPIEPAQRADWWRLLSDPAPWSGPPDFRLVAWHMPGYHGLQDSRHMRALLDRPELLKPVYVELEGWQEKLEHARVLDELPSAARAYIRFLETETGAPIFLVSVGPRRSETIVLHNPFVGRAAAP